MSDADYVPCGGYRHLHGCRCRQTRPKPSRAQDEIASMRTVIRSLRAALETAAFSLGYGEETEQGFRDLLKATKKYEVKP